MPNHSEPPSWVSTSSINTMTHQTRNRAGPAASKSVDVNCIRNHTVHFLIGGITNAVVAQTVREHGVVYR